METDEPQLPHQLERPKRYKVRSPEETFYSTPKDYYHQHYYEAIDLIMTCINSLFN